MNCKYCEEHIDDDEYVILVKKEMVPHFAHETCLEEDIVDNCYLNVQPVYHE